MLAIVGCGPTRIPNLYCGHLSSLCVGDMVKNSFSSISVLIFFGSTLSLWVIWKVFVWIWSKPRKLEKLLREQGLKGNPPKFFYGDLKEFQSVTKKAQSKPIELTHRIIPRVSPFVLQTVERYGPLSYTWFGSTPRVNIIEPELIRDVLSIKFGHFSKIEPNPLTKLILQGVVSHEGEKWAKHRRIITPAFHLEKLKMMVPAMYASCIELINSWEKLVLNGSCELDACPEFRYLTGDVISRTAFGSCYEEGRRIFKLQTEQAELVSPLFQSIYLPGFRFLPTKRNRRIKEIDREIRTILNGMINKRENAVKDGEAHNDDLLGLLLDSNSKQIQEQNSMKNFGMTIDEIIDECKLFYFAGQESTSTLLVWTVILLGMHQEWQARAREEVLQVFGESKPNFEELNRLRIVTMILYEVLRLYPPVEVITRYNYKEMKLGKISLPPGVEIGIPTLLLHHDHELWGKDAEEFNPERFSEGISKATKNQVSFFPFSWGPRMCIGQNFAIIEAKMAIALILQHFSFELSPTYVHAPYAVLTIQPQHGAQIILRKL